MHKPASNHWEDFQRIIPTLPSGALAEFGVYNGGSSAQLTKFGREVYAFDTFEGMPTKGYIEELDRSDPPGKWKPTHDVVTYLQGLGVHVYKGEFAQTLPTVPSDITFAFGYLDCDWYNSYKQAIYFLLPRMPIGGVILMDDYHACPGAHKAVDEIVQQFPQLTFDGNKTLTVLLTYQANV